MSTVQGDRHSKWIGVSEIGVSEFLKGNTLIASNRAIVMFLSSQILRPFRDHTPIMARRTPRLRRVQTRRWAQRPCLKAYHTGRRTNLVNYNGSSSTNKMINPYKSNIWKCACVCVEMCWCDNMYVIRLSSLQYSTRHDHNEKCHRHEYKHCASYLSILSNFYTRIHMRCSSSPMGCKHACWNWPFMMTTKLSKSTLPWHKMTSEVSEVGGTHGHQKGGGGNPRCSRTTVKCKLK